MTHALPILCTLFFIAACFVRQAPIGSTLPMALPVLEGPEDAEAMMHELWQDPSGADETAQAVPLPVTSSGVGPTLFTAEVDSDRLATQLTLGRAAVGECGWLLQDCAAGVWHTLARRTAMVLQWISGMTLRKMVLSYCSVFRGKHEGRRVWVRGLNADGKRPSGWPESASWSKHAVIWNRMYERAGLFLDGKVKDPCRGKPIHTGGDMDSHRMDPDDWRKVYCGVTHTRTSRQNFWERR